MNLMKGFPVELRFSTITLLSLLCSFPGHSQSVQEVFENPHELGLPPEPGCSTNTQVVELSDCIISWEEQDDGHTIFSPLVDLFKYGTMKNMRLQPPRPIFSSSECEEVFYRERRAELEERQRLEQERQEQIQAFKSTGIISPSEIQISVHDGIGKCNAIIIKAYNEIIAIIGSYKCKDHDNSVDISNKHINNLSRIASDMSVHLNNLSNDQDQLIQFQLENWNEQIPNNIFNTL
jgi:hypothetical protein